MMSIFLFLLINSVSLDSCNGFCWTTNCETETFYPLEIDLGQKLEMSSSSPTSSPMDASEAFYKTAFVIAPKISASLSMIGSILILIDVWRRGKRNRKAQHRILLGMSIVDIHSSIWTALSSYPIKGGVVSNQPLCSAQGWGLQMSITVPIYNTMLSALYLLVVRYKWSEGRLRKMEYFFHGMPLIFGLTTSFAGLGLKLYNNARLWCWISSYPSTCKGSYKNNGVNDCVRGNNAQIYRLAFYYGPLFLTIFLSILLMGSTVQYVVSIERKVLKYNLARSGVSYSRRVATQSFCYLAAFFITWTPLVTSRCIEFIGNTPPRWLLLLGAFFASSQGLFNCLVYFRPNILKYKNKHPEMNWCRFIFHVICSGRTSLVSSYSNTV